MCPKNSLADNLIIIAVFGLILLFNYSPNWQTIADVVTELKRNEKLTSFFYYLVYVLVAISISIFSLFYSSACIHGPGFYSFLLSCCERFSQLLDSRRNNMFPEEQVGYSQTANRRRNQVKLVNDSIQDPQKNFLPKTQFPEVHYEWTTKKTAVSEAVKQNIKLIERDLMVTESSLLDELQTNGYLTEQELRMLKNSPREDQAHNFVEKVEDLDDKCFKEILDILSKSSFGHIAKALTESYSRLAPYHASNIDIPCGICRIKTEVDIKELRCNLKQEDFLPRWLYSAINQCHEGKGNQDNLWDRLFTCLRSSKIKNVLRTFINFFNKKRHHGLYKQLLRKPPVHFVCICNDSSPAPDAENYWQKSCWIQERSDKTPVIFSDGGHIRMYFGNEGIPEIFNPRERNFWGNTSIQYPNFQHYRNTMR